jgi:hypothetical protein
MAYTYSKIATYTVGSGGIASIDFTSIPQTYTDLCLKVSLRSAAASVNPGLLIKFNGSAIGFTGRNVYGTGSAAASYSDTSGEIGILAGNNATANTFGNAEIYIPNYAGSNYKSFSVDSLNENNATSANQYLYANLWSNTAAITSITLLSGGSVNFLQYSTAHLYGIKAEV